MKNITIYLAGGMSKFGKNNFDKCNNWRIYCQQILENCDSKYDVKVINPNDYYNFVDTVPKYDTEREIMEFDLHKIRTSDLIILNFNDMYSLGSMAELAIAYERRIPVIGLNMDNHLLHPWQQEMTNRIFIDIEELLEYVKDFYMT